MSSGVKKQFEVRITTRRSWPLVHLGVSSDGQFYATARGSNSVEDVFESLRRAIDDVSNAVEVARREHFAKEVHPKLTGCPGDCQKACPCD